jgi:putative membrane protein
MLRLSGLTPWTIPALGLWGFSETAFAHIVLDSADDDRGAGLFAQLTTGFLHGNFNELISTALLIGYWLLYLAGSRRQAPPRHRILCFHLATILCLTALSGPIDNWAATNAAAHMTQHMLFMVVIAPLWVLSRPLPQIAAGGGKFNAALWKPMLRLTRSALSLAYLHGAMIWLWHMPWLYLLALENPWWHSVEHACFLVTAALFWWAVLSSNQRDTVWALLAVLLTLMHTGFLGAVLTFAQAPLYGASRPLADQQLAGLIMWIAGSIPYMIAAMWIGYRWYLRLLRRMATAVC